MSDRMNEKEHNRETDGKALEWPWNTEDINLGSGNRKGEDQTGMQDING